VAGVGVCGGDVGEKSAWYCGRDGFGVIFVSIGSCSSKQNPSRICCRKVSTAISRSGGESWSVKEVDGVAVGIARGVFTG